MPNNLHRFLNDDGQVQQWPAKRANQRLVLEYLVSKFETETSYSEQEVNELLRSWHTFGDWAILRRALVDEGLMTRKRDGSEYRCVNAVA